MGGATFIERAKGKTANEAFCSARESAQWKSGHGGYTGTIAEKDEFILIDVPSGENAEQFANALIADGDPRVDDKWGPAGCISLGGSEWLFFGWASC